MPSLRPLIKISPSEMDCLQPHAPVDGLIISAFLRIIERRSRYYPTVPSVWAFDTLFVQNWRSGGFEAVQRRFQGVNLFDLDLLLVPIHLPEVGPIGHWALIAVKMDTKEILSFDSLRLSRQSELQEIEEFLCVAAEREGNSYCIGGWVLQDTPQDCPLQTDGVSCGAFVCVFADKLARQSRIRGLRIDALKARKTISSVIRRERFDHEVFSPLVSDLQDLVRSFAQSIEIQPLASTIDLCSPVPMECDSLNPSEINLASRSIEVDKTSMTLTIQDPQIQSTGIHEDKLLTSPTEDPSVDLGEVTEDMVMKHLTSPCLSLETSDVEDLLLATPPASNGVPQVVDLPGSSKEPGTQNTIENRPDCQIHITVNTKQDTNKKPTVSKPSANFDHHVPKTVSNTRYLITVNNSREECRQVSRYGPGTSGYQPWVPKNLIRRAHAACSVPLNSRQKKNKRWRVYLSDGSYVRMRPHQLKRLTNRR